MKVSVNSWHYRLQMWVAVSHVWRRKDLCSYMRGFTITVIFGAFLAWVFGAGFIVSTAAYTFSPSKALFGSIVINGCLTGVLYLMMLASSVSEKMKWKPKWKLSIRLPAWLYAWLYKERQFPQIHKPKRPNLQNNIFIQWLKAKKHHICPLIEFVEVYE